jgi:hypothetical protein
MCGRDYRKPVVERGCMQRPKSRESLRSELAEFLQVSSNLTLIARWCADGCIRAVQRGAGRVVGSGRRERARESPAVRQRGVNVRS